MPEVATPRQIVKEMLQGTPPPRPLFLPMVFALGARLENVPLRAFLGNATKISNTLRQIRGHARAEGITCYFDPYLEAEALGATIEWGGDTPALRRAKAGADWSTPEEAVKRGRVPVAVEVIRRLNVLVRDGTLLMAVVSGPFTVADQLGCGSTDDLLDCAAAAITKIASAFAEAGANVVFVREQMPPRSAEGAERWAELLSPIFNVLRFYGALPVLQLGAGWAGNWEALAAQSWDCVVSVPLDSIASNLWGRIGGVTATGVGLALSVEVFAAGAPSKWKELLTRAVGELRPALVTTTGDVAGDADMKRLAAVLDVVRG